MSTWDERYEKQKAAPGALRPQWNAWADAEQATRVARKTYYDAAQAGGFRLCSHCDKPMPPGDNSNTCDGCHLGWGWDTPEGRKVRELATLDAQIEALTARRAKL